jgi:hypothetical protein
MIVFTFGSKAKLDDQSISHETMEQTYDLSEPERLHEPATRLMCCKSDVK